MMPHLTINLPLSAERLDQIRTAFTAAQADPLTVANTFTPGLFAQVADEPLRQIAEGSIPLLSVAAVLAAWDRRLQLNFSNQ